ncbi:unnamed protein product [Rotaria sordida]|uniref:Uncharacterized protein n=1 Tax=Rotaria sordida TaxID=392033 RepID=A0A818TXP0_9BILA|nr:unnamed protein product [Rotaria sordida]CAF1386149.1 unnamed protein product [Rotaria sordida]CAF3689437.1 unnamed protein product [Rotaria sordida]CAF3999910.1 unnamed protein product [Rotaria sordida]
MVPPSLASRIHTMTLFEANELLSHSTIYSNVQHFILNSSQINSLATVTALVQHFPNLHSLEIQLVKNDEYYDNLDMLLNHEHLPHLFLLKTNWTDTYCSDIDLWIAAKTSLKWRSTPFYGHRDQDDLVICL